MKKIVYGLILVVMLVFLPACGKTTVVEERVVYEEVTVEVPVEVEVEVTRVPTVAPQPTKTPKPEPKPTEQLSSVSFPSLKEYYPIKGCSSSVIHKGDTVVVMVDRLFVRETSDNHPSDNIDGHIFYGDVVKVIGNPECSWGWIMWPVRVNSELSGWIAESDGSGEHWAIPINSNEVASVLSSKEQKAYKEVSAIMNSSLSEGEKRERVQHVQKTYGAEVLANVMRIMPVYDEDTGKFYSFDSYMRDMVGEPSSGSAFEKDPVGVGIDLFLDPDPDNIIDLLGLD